MFNSKFIVKILSVLLLFGVISACAIFQDFLTPSDLVNSLEARDGVQIVNIKTTPNTVRNTGGEKFTVSCSTISRYNIAKVLILQETLLATTVGIIVVGCILVSPRLPIYKI